MDPSISESFFGYIIAVYSVGQIISSPLFGYWSNRIKGVRLPIVIGFIFMLVGNMIYLTLEFADVPYRGAFLIVSRLLLGIGSGFALCFDSPVNLKFSNLFLKLNYFPVYYLVFHCFLMEKLEICFLF